MHMDRNVMLEDIAAVSGARMVYPGFPASMLDGEWLGSAKTIEIAANHTWWTAFDDKLDGISAYIARLENTAGTDWERDRIRERIAALDGGLRTLMIREATDSETKWRMAIAERIVAKIAVTAKHGVLTDFRAMVEDPRGLPLREFWKMVPDKERVDPWLMWSKAIEIAVSAATMIRSTEVVICKAK